MPDSLEDTVREKVYEGVVAHNHGEPGTMTDAIMKRVWPIVHHYQVQLAKTKVKLDSISSEIEANLHI